MADEYDFSDFGSDDDLNSYDYPIEGIYHLMAENVDDSRERVNGVQVDCQILAGTTKSQQGKKFRETFWDPSPESKDGGRFAKKRVAKFARATGLLSSDNLGKRASVDWKAAEGRQFVAKLVNYERKNDDGRVYKGAQIDGISIYAVNAPEVAEVPKDQGALALIPGLEVPASNVGVKSSNEVATETSPKQSGSEWDNL